MEQLPDDVKQLLEQIVGTKLEEFSVSLHDPNIKGSGHLGEFFFVSLEERFGEKKHEFAVKRSLACESDKFQKLIDNAYTNEIYFYSSLVNAYREMEQKFSAQTFDKLSIFYGADDKHTMLVFNNLKLSGFKTHPKPIPLDKAHYDLVFKTYGRFHALSFALRHLYPEKYAAARDSFKNAFESSGLQTSAGFKEEMSKWIGPSPQLREILGDILEQRSRKSYFYEGEYEMLVHGDCWSNNIMFSYDISAQSVEDICYKIELQDSTRKSVISLVFCVGFVTVSRRHSRNSTVNQMPVKAQETNNVKDIRLIDFQLCRVGTPVFDLSYCFYSGASKALLSQLNYFLDVYHRSLSQSLKQFGLSSEVVYPMSVLKEEWKKYCKFGFFSAVTLWKLKLAPDEEAPDLTLPEDQVLDKFSSDNFVTEEYLQVVSDLVEHLKENNFV